MTFSFLKKKKGEIVLSLYRLWYKLMTPLDIQPMQFQTHPLLAASPSKFLLFLTRIKVLGPFLFQA
jgi:hypothetical protein